MNAEKATPILIRIEGLTKRFGALTAVDRVDFSLARGRLHSIIGPNGAGKTTFFNLISGELPPTAGRIFFQDRDITRLQASQIAHLGIGRSFQRTNIFPNLSVYDNAWAAAYAVRTRHPFHLMKEAPRSGEVADATWAALEEVGLQERAHHPAGELPHGEQRLLEVAITLAAGPTVLLLDEPSSGLSSGELRSMIELLQHLGQRYTILLIEHNMTVVMSISERISVFHFGTIIAEGKPEEVRTNEDVKRAYLGRRA
ncbi:MAG: ABC transporter ATP-binding protein [Deltaproteobacteria bacterium]|nr:ABC transporter ATP-binding protein [Deltaproteobacteria bacterium]